MLKLGAPIGWGECFRNNRQMQRKFISGIKLQTYNDFKKFQFMNVLENLALYMIIQKEVECMMDK